jgi:glyoxylase-like metal-dependent hydrolase (beta-lactamase superfamily II)
VTFLCERPLTRAFRWRSRLRLHSRAMEARTFDVASGIVGVDTFMAGRPTVTSGYLIRGREPALVETGPTTSAEAVKTGLSSLGLDAQDLAHIVVTHIHLDHAGGVGRLSTSFPSATVWVHERGAPHLADPTKLVSSAARVYGQERMHSLFGPVDPTPAQRIRPIDEGDVIDFGDRSLAVMYTPGHASHHVSLVDSATGAVFTGDALGVHLPDVRVLQPATPPPDIDVELGVRSIERIRERATSAGLLLFSHFGPVSEVEELCEIAAARLRKWAGIVREAMDETTDLDRITELLDHGTVGEFTERGLKRSEIDRFDILADMRSNAAGLVRYWTKRAGREGSRSSPAT